MTSFMLKIVALICMSIDHIGAVFPMFTPSVFRDIGRIAFPIYIFLIAEGVDRTRNLNKYILRLGIFAIISESAFDLAFNQTYMIEKGMPLQIDFLNSTNVYYTLFISVVTISIYEKLKNKEKQTIPNILIIIIPILYYVISVLTNQNSHISLQITFLIYAIILIYLSFSLNDEMNVDYSNYDGDYYENYIKYKKCLLAFIPVIPLFILGEIFSTDYSALGIFVIFLVYVVKSKRNRALVLTLWITFEYFYLYIDYIKFNFMNISTFIFAMLSILFIKKYNGKEGRKMKWFFYWFYPMHLAILAFILILFVRPILNGF